MARALHRLSAVQVKKATTPGMHPDGSGLYLRITPAGTKSWVFRFRWHGGRPEMGLGAYPATSLARARELAAEYRELIKQGSDPRAARKPPQLTTPAVPASQAAPAVEATTTFDDAARRFIAAHEGSWKNAKHRQQWKNTLATYVSPVCGKLDVAEVNTDHVLRVLEPIWNDKPETASRVRGRIESVLDWAKSRGLREGENPARWRGHLKHLLPAHSKVRSVRHHPAMPWREVPGFMAELTDRGMVRPAPAALALRFLILTATRSSEVLKAEWSEFDLDLAVWTIPAERMKMEKPHRVPLSPAALEIIETLAEVRQNDWLIPGFKRGRPLSDMSLLMLLRRMDRGDLTAHGFRSSFRDWAAEATSFPWEIAEAALAHQVGDATERAYARTDFFDRRREMMEAWAAFCLRQQILSAVEAPVAAVDERP